MASAVRASSGVKKRHGLLRIQRGKEISEPAKAADNPAPISVRRLNLNIIVPLIFETLLYSYGRVYTVLEEYNRELSLCVKVGKDLQDVFLMDPRFYRTPYIGQNGWVLLKVYAAPLNWTEVRDLVGGSYQLIAADRWPRTVTKGSARKTLDMVPKTSKAGTAIAARRRLSRPP